MMIYYNENSIQSNDGGQDGEAREKGRVARTLPNFTKETQSSGGKRSADYRTCRAVAKRGRITDISIGVPIERSGERTPV